MLYILVIFVLPESSMNSFPRLAIQTESKRRQLPPHYAEVTPPPPTPPRMRPGRGRSAPPSASLRHLPPCFVHSCAPLGRDHDDAAKATLEQLYKDTCLDCDDMSKTLLDIETLCMLHHSGKQVFLMEGRPDSGKTTWRKLMSLCAGAQSAHAPGTYPFCRP